MGLVITVSIYLCMPSTIVFQKFASEYFLSLQALKHDTDPEIKDTAFRCMVDLLCRYDVKEFCYNGAVDQVYSGKFGVKMEMFLRLVR